MYTTPICPLLGPHLFFVRAQLKILHWIADRSPCIIEFTLEINIKNRVGEEIVNNSDKGLWSTGRACPVLLSCRDPIDRRHQLPAQPLESAIAGKLPQSASSGTGSDDGAVFQVLPHAPDCRLARLLLRRDVRVPLIGPLAHASLLGPRAR
jgi:hypothetical protein